jgi:hypothetical protein
MRRNWFGALAIALSGCSGTLPSLGASTTGPVTIADLQTYLVQQRCADGALMVSASAPCVSAPQTEADVMVQRRHDWPAPAGYMAQDAYLGPYGPETIWSYAPFGPFVAAHGDGGEVYVIDGDTVRISITQDGGTPYIQGFYGAGCAGGSGWIAFRNDAPTGSWATVVATLNDVKVPGSCPPLGVLRVGYSQALTRYRLETVSFPFIVDGVRDTIPLQAVISEHYDHGTFAASKNMERSMWAAGVGRAVWEAWSVTNTTPVDPARCPGTNWSQPPAVGWVMYDCRYTTNIVTESAPITGTTYGWPAAGLSLP